MLYSHDQLWGLVEVLVCIWDLASETKTVEWILLSRKRKKTDSSNRQVLIIEQPGKNVKYFYHTRCEWARQEVSLLHSLFNSTNLRTSCFDPNACHIWMDLGGTCGRKEDLYHWHYIKYVDIQQYSIECRK